jgi:hypothetical protein
VHGDEEAMKSFAGQLHGTVDMPNKGDVIDL